MICLLEKICNKYDIPFLNQTILIEKFGIGVISQENKLVHYNQQGNQCIGKLLYEKIQKIDNNK